MARSEVTTEQWMDFLNAFAGTRSRAWFNDPVNNDFRFIGFGSLWWGAYRQANPGGEGYRWRLYDVSYAARVPVTRISLKQAMMYCNWLHNGRTSDWASLLDGAYDLSQVPAFGGVFDRPIERRPLARFWIPDCDEWVKAAHFDQNKFGVDTPGYWEYSPKRDEPLIYAPAEEGGEAAAAFTDFIDDGGEFVFGHYYPTASYPAMQSAFGLLDTAGCGEEMTETLLPLDPNDPNTEYWELIVEGSNASYPARAGVNDEPLRPDRLGYFAPIVTWENGLRIAAAAQCSVDVNNDRFIDFFDYIDFIACFEDDDCPTGVSADWNRDGATDVFDYIDFVEVFERGC